MQFISIEGFDHLHFFKDETPHYDTRFEMAIARLPDGEEAATYSALPRLPQIDRSIHSDCFAACARPIGYPGIGWQ
jgi:hypothetical protein